MAYKTLYELLLCLSLYLSGSLTTALTGDDVASRSRFTHSRPVGPPAPSTVFTDILASGRASKLTRSRS